MLAFTKNRMDVLLVLLILAIFPTRTTCTCSRGESGLKITNCTGPDDDNLSVANFNFHAVAQPFIVVIVVMIATLSKLLYHYAGMLSSVIPESCMLVILGIALGGLIHVLGYSAQFPKFFTPHDFFLYLLPPIILEAAYSLNDSIFYDNIGSVLIYAVIGTFINCIIISLSLWGLSLAPEITGVDSLQLTEFLVFGSIIVAVDPVAVLAIFSEVGVNSNLYILVFGESLLNDGVSVVLYSVMQAYNQMDSIGSLEIFLGVVKFLVVSVGGLLVGILVGILSAVLTKYTYHVKVVEPITVFACAFLSYLMADMFELSGIISLIGCGMMQDQYSLRNVSQKSATSIKYFIKVASSANEIVIFLFLGMAVVRHNHVWSTGFILWAVFLCLIVRFIVCYSLTYLINSFDRYRVRKIGLDEQFIMSYGGLRGAVCFSLVMMLNEVEIPSKSLFVTTTLAIIIFTVMVQGLTVKPFVKLFKITLQANQNLNCLVYLTKNVSDHLMAGMEDIIGFHGKYYLKELLEYYDDHYFKKWLQRAPTKADAEIAQIYQEIMLRDHFQHLEMSGAAGIPDYKPKKESDNVEKPSLAALVQLIHKVDADLEEEPKVVRRKKIKSASSSPTSPTHFSYASDYNEDFWKEMETIIPLRDIEPTIRLEDGQSTPRHSTLHFRLCKSRSSSNHSLNVEMRNLLSRQQTSMSVLHQKYDRNLTRESNQDLMHQLQLKRQTTINLANLKRKHSDSSESLSTLFEHQPARKSEDEEGKDPLRNRPPLKKDKSFDHSPSEEKHDEDMV
ncbi:sodium/hydrogen exchanger 1-like isoform X1 [Octopus vulgaris]|uniref:Sodium/hydrogen exchanger n=1 Tax=Octopus vulgaris TaxID=6645 RepID=A0AA36BN85_OCTVU|nr:sodium/hydrogen exchanger 1-like isoform X1 [Octopus vulgaris]